MYRSLLLLALLGIVGASLPTKELHEVAKRGVKEYLERGFIRRDFEESGEVDLLSGQLWNFTYASCLSGVEYGIELNVSDCEDFSDIVSDNFVECYEEHEYDDVTCQVTAFICSIKEIMAAEEEEEEEKRQAVSSSSEEEEGVDCDVIATEFVKLAAGCALESSGSELLGCLIISVSCLAEISPNQNCTDFKNEYTAYCDANCVQGLDACKRELDVSPIACIGALKLCREKSDVYAEPGLCFGMYVKSFPVVRLAMMRGLLDASGINVGVLGGGGAGAGSGGGSGNGGGSGGGGGGGGGGAGSGGAGGGSGSGSGGSGSGSGSGSGGAGAGSGSGGGAGGGGAGAGTSKREHFDKWEKILLERREKLESENKLEASKRHEQKWKQQLLSRREMLDSMKAPTVAKRQRIETKNVHSITKLGKAENPEVSKREELNRKKVELLRRILKELDLKK